MFSLTAETVRALAPDAGALKAGQTLATPARWSALGRNERALWGSCKGSGAEPYRVSVDLGAASAAAKCTCPSRKFPCKHGLGLMLLAIGHAGALPSGTPPQATAAWLAGRDGRAKATPLAERSDGEPAGAEGAPAGTGGPSGAAIAAPDVADEKARARRIASRERRIAQGLDEFRIWLQDLARRGLAEVVGEGMVPFEAAAARLVDAQAPGIARALRAAGSRAMGIPTVRGGRARPGARPAKGRPALEPGSGSDDWADDLIDVIGRLFVLAETYGRRESLAEPLVTEVRTLVGWTQREAELPETDAVTDTWLVLGRRHEPDDRLRATRTYLRGRDSGRDAVLLDWEPIRSVPANEPPPGAALRGTLLFYPSATPLRAALRGDWAPVEATPPPSGAPATWRAAVAPYAAALTTNPWLERLPVLVGGLRPVVADDVVRYSDADGEVVAMRFAAGVEASLRAFSGGHPVDLFGEWNGRELTVLAAGDGATWVALPGTEETAADETVRGVTAPASQAWEDLRAHAILGTSRSAPGGDIQALAARLADRSPEDRLLALAASLAVRRRAGGAIARAAPAEPVEPALPEAAPRAGRAAAATLAASIGTTHLVEEWVELAAATGVVVPPELLPRLLAMTGVDDVPGLDGVIGRRGAWFRGSSGAAVEIVARARAARTAAELRELLGDPATAARGHGPELREVLAALRGSDAGAAREWLAEAWGGLTSPARAAAIRALAVALGPADAGLVDRLATEETNKARREQLAVLALRIPGSAIRGRIEGRAQALLSVKGVINRSLDLQPPSADMIEAMERDGVLIPPHLTIAAQRIQHVLIWHLEHVAPNRWTDWLRAPASEVIRLLSGMKELRYWIGSSLRSATIAHADSEMAEALISQPGNNLGWQLAGIWVAVPAARREQLLIAKILAKADVNDRYQAQSLGEALHAIPQPWSRDLLAAIRFDVRTALAAAGTRRPGAVNRLRSIATHIPSATLPELAELVAERARTIDDPTTLDPLADLITARRSLAAAFAPGA